jgi:hypothetical protein
MNFKFENENFLAVYEGDYEGRVTLSVREIREDLWEWNLSFVSTDQGAIKGTAARRDLAIEAGAYYMFDMDSTCEISEYHDGVDRISVFFLERTLFPTGVMETWDVEYKRLSFVPAEHRSSKGYIKAARAVRVTPWPSVDSTD